MLKNCAKRKLLITGFAFLIFLITLSIPKNEERIKNIDVTYLQGIPRPIYVANKDEYISRIILAFKSSDPLELVRETIRFLTIGSEKNAYLPNNFYAVIPRDTKILSMDLQDETLKIDFSKDLLNTNNTKKMIEAIIYSLTEITGIKKVIIYIDGKLLNETINSTLPSTLTRDIGINTLYDIDSLKNISKTTVYYSATDNDLNYYVPVTLLSNDNKDKLEVIIERLKSRPFVKTNLMSYLNTTAVLNNYEYKGDKLLLSFNESLYQGLLNDELKEIVNYSLVLSIKDSLDVSEVIIKE